MNTAPAWAALAGAAAITVIRVRSRGVAFSVLWIASACAGIALGGEWHFHYLQQVIPPLALLAGAAPDALRGARRRGAWLLPTAAGLGLFVSSELPAWRRTPLAVSIVQFARPPYLFAEEAARRIAARTSPNDRIYVAFSEPEVYYLAARRASAPQLFYRELLHPALKARVLDALARGEPQIVALVGAPPGVDYADFAALVERRYVQFTDVGPFRLFERRQRSFAE